MQYDALKSGNLFEAQLQYFRKHGMGRTFEIKLFGKVGFLTTDPENVQAILVTNFEGQGPSHLLPNTKLIMYLPPDFDLGSRRAGFYPMIGEGIFTQDGQPWKHSRELLRRQFVRIQYQNLKVFEGPTNGLLAGLKSTPNGIVDLQSFFLRFTLATTTSLIFGEPFAGLDPTDHAQFGEYFDYCAHILAMRIRLSDWS